MIHSEGEAEAVLGDRGPRSREAGRASPNIVWAGIPAARSTGTAGSADVRS